MPSTVEIQRRPYFQLPPGAVDAHCHIFGPAHAFAYAPERTYTPVDHGKEQLTQVHARLGVSRAVIVQASCHGTDHSALLDALASRPDAYRGVAIVDDTFGDRALRDLHEAGVRGARFNVLRQGGRAPDLAPALRRMGRIAALDMGWHVVLHIDGADIAALTPTLRRIPMPYAIDHMGRINSGLGTAQPAFADLMELARDERCWIKICDSPRISPPPFPDAIPIAAAIVAAIPDRVLWGSDLPHPDPTHGSEEAWLVELIPRYAPTAEQQRKLLVDNPACLYGFAAVESGASR